MEGGETEEGKTTGKQEEEDEDEEMVNKEVLQEAEIGKLVFRFILFATIIITLLLVIVYVLNKEIGQDLYMEQDWLWFTVFFGSQLFGFLVVDTIAILFVTCCLLKSSESNKSR